VLLHAEKTAPANARPTVTRTDRIIEFLKGGFGVR
jgi:hypothetical protein